MQNVFFRFAVVASLTLSGPGQVLAQSAGAPGGGSSPSPSRMAPSTTEPTNGAPATGTGPDGGNTPTQNKADREMQKDTTICKGC